MVNYPIHHFTGGDEDDEDDPSWYDDDESLSAPSLTFSEDDEDESDSGDNSDNEDEEADSNVVTDEYARESTPSEGPSGAIRRSRSREILDSESTTSDSDADGAAAARGGSSRATRAAIHRMHSVLCGSDAPPLGGLDPPVDDWFFGSEEEHASTKRYVRENVVDQAKFDNSTDSDTATDEDQRDDTEDAPKSASGGPNSAPTTASAGKDKSESTE